MRVLFGRWRTFPGAALFAVALAAAVSAGNSRVGAAEPSGRQVIDAVVAISALVPENARTADSLGTVRAGSGIVIDDQGLVLTIGYLMMEATAAAVSDAKGEMVRAAPVAYDHNTGFGLLRATGPLGIKPVEFGASDDLKEGAPVIVVAKGGPLPVMPARVASRREFVGYWEYLLEDAIYTVPPHPHFGGAALIDASGRLVGIGSIQLNDAVPGPQPIPGNMFVPIDRLKPILAELLENGRTRAPAHPWLGLYVEEAGGRLLVVRVAADGPAEAAGIRPGDVVMGVGGKRVTTMGELFRKIWARGEAGSDIPLDMVVLASGTIDITTVTVQSRDRLEWLKLSRGF